MGWSSFASSTGLSGVGIEFAQWKEVKERHSGSVIRALITTTLPTGPDERTITGINPFTCCDRERHDETTW